MPESGAIAANVRRGEATGVRASSRYYIAVAATFLLIMIWGFTPSFYLRPAFTTHHSLDLSGAAPMPLLVVLHGLAITAWFLLFFVQVLLAATRRVDVHRQLGIAGASVAALLVVLTLPTMILSIPRFDHAHIPREVTDQVVIGDSLALVWFTVLVGAAIRLRRRADSHKRLMVLGSIAILYPAQARIGDMLGNPPLAIVGGTIVLCLSLVIYDYVSCKRLHNATVWGGLLLVAANPLLMACISALNGHYKWVDELGRLAYAMAGARGG